VIVGSWNVKTLDSHGSGEWSLTDKVQWPSGTNIIPSDRVGKVEKVLSTAFFIVLCGLILSALIATVVHRSGFTDTMPESLITIFVGLAIGAIVRVSSNMEVRDAASFSNEIFMLGLLPIIIAESGYSLDKAIFFKNFY
jgi:sodium/hydrogen exchanger-like protein 6/7